MSCTQRESRSDYDASRIRDHWQSEAGTPLLFVMTCKKWPRMEDGQALLTLNLKCSKVKNVINLSLNINSKKNTVQF